MLRRFQGALFSALYHEILLQNEYLDDIKTKEKEIYITKKLIQMKNDFSSSGKEIQSSMKM